MEQYLIALDLDGTLLRKDGTIGVRTKEVIEELMRNNHIVMIATGRPYRASLPYHQQLSLNGPLAYFNGAAIVHPTDDCFSSIHRPLPLGVTQSIINSLDPSTYLNIFAEVHDDLYLLTETTDMLKKIFHFGTPKEVYGDLLQTLHQSPTSLILHTTEQFAPQIEHLLRTFHATVTDHKRWQPPYHLIEIVQKGVNKGTAVEWVGHQYNIPKERMIAFGDEWNDVEMFDYVKYGIAMQNGSDRLKKRAYAVTKSHEEDGIATFLADFFLKV
ncbi:MAG: HAD family hydrolase [Bacilli bacterium]